MRKDIFQRGILNHVIDFMNKTVLLPKFNKINNKFEANKLWELVFRVVIYTYSILFEDFSYVLFWPGGRPDTSKLVRRV